MTYTTEKITDFVNFSLNQIDSHISYANTIEHYSRDEKIRWAQEAIEREKEQAFGALIFLKCYLKEIDDKTYLKLSEAIADTAFTAKHRRVYDEIN